jgi:hypothetical protein
MAGVVNGKTKLGIVIALTLPLGACGAAAVVQSRQAKDTKMITDMRPIFQNAKDQCDADFKSRELDPIRDKTPLDLPRTVPLNFLVVTSKPTPAKKKLYLSVGVSLPNLFLSFFRFVIAGLACAVLPPALAGVTSAWTTGSSPVVTTLRVT